jgi:hypothetical protein
MCYYEIKFFVFPKPEYQITLLIIINLTHLWLSTQQKNNKEQRRTSGGEFQPCGAPPPTCQTFIGVPTPRRLQPVSRSQVAERNARSRRGGHSGTTHRGRELHIWQGRGGDRSDLDFPTLNLKFKFLPDQIKNTITLIQNNYFFNYVSPVKFVIFVIKIQSFIF